MNRTYFKTTKRLITFFLLFGLMSLALAEIKPPPPRRPCETEASVLGPNGEMMRFAKDTVCSMTNPQGLESFTKDDEQLDKYVRCHFPEGRPGSKEAYQRFQNLKELAAKAEEAFSIPKTYILCVAFKESLFDTKLATKRNGDRVSADHKEAHFLGLGHFDKDTRDDIIKSLGLGKESDKLFQNIGDRGTQNMTEFDRGRIGASKNDENRMVLLNEDRNVVVGKAVYEGFTHMFGAGVKPQEALANLTEPKVGLALIALNARRNITRINELLDSRSGYARDKEKEQISLFDEIAFKSLAHNAGPGIVGRSYFQKEVNYCNTMANLYREYNEAETRLQNPRARIAKLQKALDDINRDTRMTSSAKSSKIRSLQRQISVIQGGAREVQARRDRRAIEIDYTLSIRNCVENNNADPLTPVAAYSCDLSRPKSAMLHRSHF